MSDDRALGCARQARDAWVMRAAWGLVTLQAVLRGFATLRGYFYLDDFAFVGRSMEHALLSPSYLFEPYNSHFMPGAMVWVWVTSHAFPMSFAAVGLTIIALQAVLSVRLVLLLRSLFGARALILPPLAIALLSPVSLPGSLWWAAALNQIPQQLAIVGVLTFAVRWVQQGRRSSTAYAAGWFAFGLLFSEKTLLALPVTFAIVWAYFTTGSMRARAVTTARRDAALWVPLGLLAICYTVYYLVQVPTPLRQTPAPGHDVADLFLGSVFRATLPGIAGGPFRWQPIGYAGAIADPSSFVVVVLGVLVAASVGVTCLVHRRAARAWAILGGYVLLNIAILARSRATLVGPIVGLEYRYQTEVALVAALCLAFSTMPVIHRGRRSLTQRLLPGRALSWIRSEVVAPMRAVGALPALPVRSVLGVAATAVLTLSAAWSTLTYDPWWVHNPAKPWVQRVTSQLAGVPPGTVLANGSVPQDVTWGLLYPYNQIYRVLSPVLTTDKRLDPGHSAPRLVMPDDTGTLRLALVAGSRAQAGPTKGCGWALERGTVHIPLDTKVPLQSPVVRIGYLASAQTTLHITGGATTVAVPIGAGLGASFIQLSGPVQDLAVTAGHDNVRVCTDDITAGYAVPVLGSAP